MVNLKLNSGIFYPRFRSRLFPIVKQNSCCICSGEIHWSASGSHDPAVLSLKEKELPKDAKQRKYRHLTYRSSMVFSCYCAS